MANWSLADTPSQASKTILITGANTGLGLGLAKLFVDPARFPSEKHPAKLVLTGRTLARINGVIEAEPLLQVARASGKVETVALELSDLDSVRAAAADVQARFPHIDVLVLNAGLLSPELQKTKQGFEMTLGVCHVGHFLLTKLLYPLLWNAPEGARVLPVSSMGHAFAKPKLVYSSMMDFTYEERKYDQYEAYFEAKLMNILFAKELAKRSGTLGQTHDACGRKQGVITTVSNSPGFGNSDLYRNAGRCGRWLISNFMAASNDELAENSMRAATDLACESGCYMVPKRMKFYGPPIVVDPIKEARNMDLAKELWEKTEAVIGETFEVSDKREAWEA